MLRFLKKWTLMPFAAKHVWMPGRTFRGPVVLNEIEEFSLSHVQRHIEMLASEIGERHDGKIDALNKARDYIESAFAQSGMATTRQNFPLGGQVCSNVIAELDGDSNLVFVIGAHYDTTPGSPGANDNGSGVAALLEMARLLSLRKLPMRFRFVAFANEEHVGLPASSMGSYLYASNCRQRQDQIVGMWSLETLGFYSQTANSQRYPDPLNLFYPTTGNFVAFVGNYDSRSFVRTCVGAFRSQRKFPCEGIAAPESISDILRSDHWGFWQSGYLALMVTDTANYRYSHYHSATDTPDKFDPRCLARVINVLADAAITVASTFL